MKRLQIVTVIVVMLLTSLFFISQTYADGKQIFLDNKCNKCHTAKKMNIQKLPRTAVAEEDEDDTEVKGADGKKVEPKDMTDAVAAAKKENLDVEKWLTKTVANKENRKHKKKFNGSPADLKTLSDWLKSSF